MVDFNQVIVRMPNETDVESQNIPIQVDDCIICLSNDNDNTPILNIRIMCSDDRQYITGNTLCNCSYNIHTKCFIETNRVFYNVCPCCRNNWWKDIDAPCVMHGNAVTETDTQDGEVSCIVNICKNVVNCFIGSCIFVFFMFSLIAFTN